VIRLCTLLSLNPGFAVTRSAHYNGLVPLWLRALAASPICNHQLDTLNNLVLYLFSAGAGATLVDWLARRNSASLAAGSEIIFAL